MPEKKRTEIRIPEICRVEGHAAVVVDIKGDSVEKVQLDVFEGTRFFERIVVGHTMGEIPHITSRVCAICSTGHVLAAIHALERLTGFAADEVISLLRELMHLGMFIESHATHIYALALPDFLGAQDLLAFATEHEEHFLAWTRLRNLGALIQTIVGGRPFHPVNLHPGGFSRLPQRSELERILEELASIADLPVSTCELLMKFSPPVKRISDPTFLALIPFHDHYGYFGDRVRSSDGWEDSIDNCAEYLGERSVPYSHARQSRAKGKLLMVGSMARLSLFGDRLAGNARQIYRSSAMAYGDNNTIWNNLAQAIEIVEAVDRAREIVQRLLVLDPFRHDAAGITSSLRPLQPLAGSAVGAVECPRGTLYHFYELDERGVILKADLITPSAQNTARIEQDIKEVVSQVLASMKRADVDIGASSLEQNLETLIRAYDPCNTCATHMVSVRFKNPI